MTLTVESAKKFISTFIVTTICIGFHNTSFSQANSLFFIVTDSEGVPLSNTVVRIDDSQFETLPSSLAETSNTLIMDQIDKQFQPKVLIVNKGQNVRFPNSDDIRHHVYSFSDAKSFEIKLFKGVHGETILMDQEGLVELGCNIHDDMLGYIYVNDGAYAQKTNMKGEVRFTLPSDFNNSILSGDSPLQVKAWHPRLHTNKGQHILFDVSLTELRELGSKAFPLQLSLKPLVEDTGKRGFKPRFRSQGLQ